MWLEIGLLIIVILVVLVSISALVLAVNRRRLPPPFSFVEVDGIKIHYREMGTGPPLVLIHGSNGSLQDYSLSVMGALSKEFRVIAFDRPGRGYSGLPTRDHDRCSLHADLIAQAWRELGAERPLVVGHSSAGAVVMDLVVRVPQVVRGAVLISGVVYPPGEREVPVSGLYRLISRRYLGTFLLWTVLLPIGMLVGRFLLKFMFSPDPVPPVYREVGVALALRPASIRVEAEDLACLAPTLKAIEDRYPQVDVPLVILYGLADRVVPPEGQSMRLHREIPSSLAVALPRTGHLPMFTRPEELVRAVEEAYRRSGPDTRSPDQ
jgi:pimeloyl-ACP methyl ester carboxylesterase